MNAEIRLELGKDTLDARVLKTGALVMLITALYLTANHQNARAIGFLIGSALSLFSLFTIKAVIRHLFQPDGKRYKAFFAALMLFLKLPAYGIILYFALNSKSVSLGAVCFGLILMPVVITLKTLGQALKPNVPGRNAQTVEITETAQPV